MGPSVPDFGAFRGTRNTKGKLRVLGVLVRSSRRGLSIERIAFTMPGLNAGGASEYIIVENRGTLVGCIDDVTLGCCQLWEAHEGPHGKALPQWPRRCMS